MRRELRNSVTAPRLFQLSSPIAAHGCYSCPHGWTRGLDAQIGRAVGYTVLVKNRREIHKSMTSFPIHGQSLCKTIRNNIKSIRKSIENHPQIEPQYHMQNRTHTTGRSGSFSWGPPRRSPQGRALENASSPRGRVWRTAALHGAECGERPFSMAWVGNARSPRGRGWENARSSGAGFRERPFSTAGSGERPFSPGPISENARSPRPGWEDARYLEGWFQRTPVLRSWGCDGGGWGWNARFRGRRSPGSRAENRSVGGGQAA